MRRLLPLALFVALLSASCGEYNRALKATGPDAVQVKLTTATKYYGIGAVGLEPTATKKQKRKASAAFEKALPLLEELTALTRGDTLFERVSYMYAKSYYGIKDYIADANSVIQNGTWVPEMSGYTQIIGGPGSAKAAFVGLNRATGDITTFHVKSVTEMAKKAPSLGWVK